MKKIIAILMAVLCVCTIFAVSVSAQKVTSRENHVKVVSGVKGGGGGEITPPSSSYSPGDTVTFHIIPRDGYKIKQVWVNGVAMGPISEYTFENIQEDSTIYAEFEKIKDETTTKGSGESKKEKKQNGGNKSPDTGANVNSIVLCSLGVLVVGGVAAGTITKKNRKED